MVQNFAFFVVENFSIFSNSKPTFVDGDLIGSFIIEVSRKISEY